MIKVCHIITELELGGAQQNTLYTVSHLDRARFDPVLIAGASGPLVEEARTGSARTIFLDDLRREVSPLRDSAALFKLTRLLVRERPGIVHTHSSKAGILGRWAALFARVPHVVHTIHGYGFHVEQPWAVRRIFVALERITARRATSAFIAVSRANLKTGLELGLFTPDHVSLIHSGIRRSDFSAPDRRDGNGRHVTIGMVACLKRQKAPLDFVRVAAKVLAGTPDREVRFVLVGDGALRRRVEAMIRSEGLESRVELLGWRRDVPQLLARWDILLHTSRWEGLPRVFPEAMASGLPIVATAVDGASEAIEDAETGFLLAPGDVEGLARRTLELVRDPALRLRMGRLASSRTRPWDIDDMVRRQERLYLGLVEGTTVGGVARSTQMEAG
ncbi:MAG: glycosyltransferase family 4 protein [Acidobacteriota bacterium]